MLGKLLDVDGFEVIVAFWLLDLVKRELNVKFDWLGFDGLFCWLGFGFFVDIEFNVLLIGEGNWLLFWDVLFFVLFCFILLRIKSFFIALFIKKK